MQASAIALACDGGDLRRGRAAQRTAAATIYRWAHRAVADIIRYCPATAVDFLEADPATRHFVALAVRGWEVHHDRAEPVLRQLAADIFSRPRRKILGRQWQCEFGGLTFLKRLPGHVLTRSRYDRLVAVIRDPSARGLITQCTRITERDLDALRPANLPLIAATSLRAVSTIGASTLEYVLAAIHRHRHDLGDTDLKVLFRQISEVKRLGPWLPNILAKSSLPPPPWEGIAAITPLRTIGEIRRAGTELNNCLGDSEQWLSALLGRRSFYRVHEPLGPAVIGLVYDDLIGTWRIGSYAGPGNRRLRPAAKRYVFSEFAAAGIRFFGDDPRQRALNGYGVTDEFPLMPVW